MKFIINLNIYTLYSLTVYYTCSKHVTNNEGPVLAF